MKIPKSFSLAGVQWSVEETEAISDMGHCDSDNARIRLRKDLPKQMKEVTFCHELVHAILFTTGKTDHNETEVDAQGHLLHQFLEQYKSGR